MPERVADKLLVFPVRYEPDTDTLSVVSPDAGRFEHKKQLSIAIRVREVKSYIARPAAVTAAIAKWYRGETNPFALLVSDGYMLGDSFEEPRAPARAEPAARPDAPAAPARDEYFMTPLPTGASPRATRPRDEYLSPPARPVSPRGLEVPPPPPPMLEAGSPRSEAMRPQTSRPGAPPFGRAARRTSPRHPTLSKRHGPPAPSRGRRPASRLASPQPRARRCRCHPPAASAPRSFRGRSPSPATNA